MTVLIYSILIIGFIAVTGMLMRISESVIVAARLLDRIEVDTIQIVEALHNQLEKK